MLKRRIRTRPLIRTETATSILGEKAQHPEYEFLTNLKQLSALHKIGELTDEEYSAAKQKLLGM